MPADDLTDPATATTFAHLDATTVLSRKISEQGIYPAGEGAGYAGGITSAAMDGVRVAEAIASCYAPFSETGK